MITQLHNENLFANFSVNDPVFGRDSPGPKSLKGVLEWFRFSNACERISFDVFDEDVNTPKDFRIGFLPIQLVFPRLRRESDIHAPTFNRFRSTLPRLTDS